MTVDDVMAKWPCGADFEERERELEEFARKLETELRWIRRWHTTGALPPEKYGTLDEWRARVDALISPHSTRNDAA